MLSCQAWHPDMRRAALPSASYRAFCSKAKPCMQQLPPDTQRGCPAACASLSPRCPVLEDTCTMEKAKFNSRNDHSRGEIAIARGFTWTGVWPSTSFKRCSLTG